MQAAKHGGYGVGRRAGQVLVAAVIGLVVLLVLTTTLLAIATNLHGHSMRQVREAQALAAAEAACSRGLVMLEQDAITSVPYSQTGVPLGRRRMDIRVVGIDPLSAGGYQIDRYEIRGTGHAGNVERTVALGGRHDSFLSYCRFLGQGGITYGAGASLSGQLYAGGDLNMSGAPVNFWDDVSVTGTVRDRGRGVFHQNVFEGAAPISLGASMDVAHYRAFAQQGGLYFSNASSTPSIDLGLFDFSTTPPTYAGAALPADFNGMVFAEGDLNVQGVLEGRSLTLVAGDDIFVTGNVRTGCSRAAHSAHGSAPQFNAPAGQEIVQTVPLDSLMASTSNTLKMGVQGSKWQRLNVYLREDGAVKGVATVERPPGTNGNYETSCILAGLTMDPSEHSYSAEVHYWSNGPASEDNSGHGMTFTSLEVAAGDPVNIGLLAKDYCYLGKYTPRVLSVDAALFARDSNWRPTDDTDGNDSDGSHWACHGVWDLDLDGAIESPNQDGYDEANVGSSTWALNINGPIITKNGGSAGAWEYQGSSQGKGTRHYNYDNDIVQYEPPDFPVILSRWAVLYWREV